MRVWRNWQTRMAQDHMLIRAGSTPVTGTKLKFRGYSIMAKRIIENGKYNMITCSECGCKFAFDKVDVETDGTVTCPQCDKANTPTVKM